MDINQFANVDLSGIAGFEALIAIAIGIFLCLYGYKLKKIAFIVVWFIIGFYLMTLAAPHITDNLTWQQILPIGAGLVLGVLGFSLEKLCIFAVAAYAVSTTIIDTFIITEPLYIGLAIAAGAIVGLVAVKLIKPVGIVTTAFSGAKLIAKYSVAQLTLAHYPFFPSILLIAAAIGILYQFKSCKNLE